MGKHTTTHDMKVHEAGGGSKGAYGTNSAKNMTGTNG